MAFSANTPASDSISSINSFQRFDFLPFLDLKDDDTDNDDNELKSKAGADKNPNIVQIASIVLRKIGFRPTFFLPGYASMF